MEVGSKLSCYLVYEDVIYAHLQKEGESIVKLDPIVPKLVFAHSNGDTELPLPDYVKYVEMFVKEHYDDIKSAFSIFKRLENIYRLLGCVSLVNKIQSKADLSVSIKAPS